LCSSARPGQAKTRLAISRGHKATSAEIKTRFTTATDLMLKVETAVRQGRLAEFMTALSRHAILIIDDIGDTLELSEGFARGGLRIKGWAKSQPALAINRQTASAHSHLSYYKQTNSKYMM